MKIQEAFNFPDQEQINEVVFTKKNVLIGALTGGTFAAAGKTLSWIAAGNIKAALIAAGLITPAAAAAGLVIYGTVATGTLLSVLVGLAANKKAIEKWGDTHAKELIIGLDKITDKRDRLIKKLVRKKVKRTDSPELTNLTEEMERIGRDLTYEIKKPKYADVYTPEQHEYLKRVCELARQGRLTKIDIKQVN